jgi:hypothetical protein
MNSSSTRRAKTRPRRLRSHLCINLLVFLLGAFTMNLFHILSTLSTAENVTSIMHPILDSVNGDVSPPSTNGYSCPYGCSSKLCQCVYNRFNPPTEECTTLLANECAVNNHTPKGKQCFGTLLANNKEVENDVCTTTTCISRGDGLSYWDCRCQTFMNKCPTDPAFCKVGVCCGDVSNDADRQMCVESGAKFGGGVSSASSSQRNEVVTIVGMSKSDSDLSREAVHYLLQAACEYGLGSHVLLAKSDQTLQDLLSALGYFHYGAINSTNSSSASFSPSGHFFPQCLNWIEIVVAPTDQVLMRITRDKLKSDKSGRLLNGARNSPLDTKERIARIKRSREYQRQLITEKFLQRESTTDSLTEFTIALTDLDLLEYPPPSQLIGVANEWILSGVTNTKNNIQNIMPSVPMASICKPISGEGCIMTPSLPFCIPILGFIPRSGDYRTNKLWKEKLKCK